MEDEEGWTKAGRRLTGLRNRSSLAIRAFECRLHTAAGFVGRPPPAIENRIMGSEGIIVDKTRRIYIIYICSLYLKKNATYIINKKHWRVKTMDLGRFAGMGLGFGLASLHPGRDAILTVGRFARGVGTIYILKDVFGAPKEELRLELRRRRAEPTSREQQFIPTATELHAEIESSHVLFATGFLPHGRDASSPSPRQHYHGPSEGFRRENSCSYAEKPFTTVS